MLPLHAAPHQHSSKKMNRHGYTGSLDTKTPTSPVPFGYAGRTNTSGESGRGFKIKTDKWEKYQPRSRGTSRRSTLMRVGSVLASLLLVVMYFVPGLRPTSILEYLFPPGEEFNIETVRYYDLSNVGGTSRGWEREERILLCAPLRDAAPHLPMFFGHLKNLTYPHNLIDLAFLVGDSKDNTAELLSDLLADLQGGDKEPKDWFGEISVIEKDFGQVVNQDVESRHGFAAQAGRRKSMAQARNWLLSAALRPVHSWVYWRDVDVETAPFTILEDLMRHNKDVIVPNVWRPLPEWLGGEQPYDLNSWQESETALALAETLDEDAVIVEGYAEYATWRPHLAYLRDPYGDPDMEMEIDGVGGVSILAKARVFRSGVHFPAFSFERHAETEGFGKMAKRMQFSVVGLPHYTIWHLYEPSFEDIRHMEEMEQEKKIREEQEKLRKERMEKIERQFDTDAKRQFEKDKEAMREARKEAAVEDLNAAAARAEEKPAADADVGNKPEPKQWKAEQEGWEQKHVKGEMEEKYIGMTGESPIEAAERRAAEAAAKARGEKVTKEEVRAGIAESEVTFERDADGKTHIRDPLGEIRQLGGGGRGGDAGGGEAFSPSLEREKEKERAAIVAAEIRAAEVEQAKVDAELAREEVEKKAASEEKEKTDEEDGWRDPRKLNLDGAR